MIFLPFLRNPQRARIDTIYGAIVAQARLSAFYRSYGVPDTPAGRFDMIVLHLSLLLRRLHGAPNDLRSLGQKVFDRFCRDMDDNLREMGVGDLAVPKAMRRVAEAYYGRARAYDQALAAESPDALAAAVARNVFGEDIAPPLGAVRLATYIGDAVRRLAAAADDVLARGHLPFPDPEEVWLAAVEGAET